MGWVVQAHPWLGWVVLTLLWLARSASSCAGLALPMAGLGWVCLWLGSLGLPLPLGWAGSA